MAEGSSRNYEADISVSHFLAGPLGRRAGRVEELEDGFRITFKFSDSDWAWYQSTQKKDELGRLERSVFLDHKDPDGQSWRMRARELNPIQDKESDAVIAVMAVGGINQLRKKG